MSDEGIEMTALARPAWCPDGQTDTIDVKYRNITACQCFQERL